jgi:hypothetical protein
VGYASLLAGLISTTPVRPITTTAVRGSSQSMATAAARRRLWRGMGTTTAAGVSGTDATLLSRLLSDPECQVKATMEKASSSAPHRYSAFWESLAAALLRASCPAKANLVSPSFLVPSPVSQYSVQPTCPPPPPGIWAAGRKCKFPWP